MDSIAEKVHATETDIDRARLLESLGFGAMDALHLTCAVRLRVDVLLKVDEKLIKKGKMNSDKLDIRVENPVIWLREVIE